MSLKLDFENQGRWEYYRCHAPAIPNWVLEERIACLKTNEPDKCVMPWNSYILNKLAILHQQWADAYADMMMKKYIEKTKE